MTYFNPKWVAGRKIVAVTLNSWKDETGQTHHAPRFKLDNGATICFVVTEQDQGGDYGVQPVYVKEAK